MVQVAKVQGASISTSGAHAFRSRASPVTSWAERWVRARFSRTRSSRAASRSTATTLALFAAASACVLPPGAAQPRSINPASPFGHRRSSRPERQSGGGVHHPQKTPFAKPSRSSIRVWLSSRRTRPNTRGAFGMIVHAILHHNVERRRHLPGLGDLAREFHRHIAGRPALHGQSEVTRRAFRSSSASVFAFARQRRSTVVDHGKYCTALPSAAASQLAASTAAWGGTSRIRSSRTPHQQQDFVGGACLVRQGRGARICGSPLPGYPDGARSRWPSARSEAGVAS